MKRRYTAPLVRKLKQEVRKDVERQRGQLVLLDNYNALKQVLEASGFSPTKRQLDKALKAGRVKALELQNTFIRSQVGLRRFKTLESRFPSINFKAQGLVLGENAFLVSTFRRSADSIKKAMLDSLQDDLDISDSARKQIGPALQKGHGEEGLAVSQVKAATTFAKAAELEGGVDFLTRNLEAFFQSAEIDEGHRQKHIELLEELKLQYFNVVTKSGKLKADYFSIITYQSQKDNVEDSKIEAEFIRILRQYVDQKFAEDLVTEFEGSRKIVDKIEGSIVHTFTGGPNYTVTTDAPKPGRDARGQITHKNAQKPVKGRIVKGPKARIQQAPVPKKSPHAGGISLLAILNARLPPTVMKNMGEPMLVNRTGRFANSVRAVDIQQTRQGYPSIGYTYDREPYQIFEMGAGRAPWATPQRDPRKIINQSIREILADYLKGRFYTRRV